METVFMVCAVVGGTLVVCQFIMTLLGMSGDHDVTTDHGGFDLGHLAQAGDHGSADNSGAEHGADHAGHDTDHSPPQSLAASIFSMLTLRTLSAAIAFFGLGGLAAQHYDMTEAGTLVVALIAGFAAIFLVARLMRFLHKLNVDGTIRVHDAIGCRGAVYLPIPGAKAGNGKVHVTVFGRSLEYQAVTSQQDLPAGASIIVVGVLGPDTVEVASASIAEAAAERKNHG